MAKSTAFILTKKSQNKFLAYYRETVLAVNATRSFQRDRFISIDKAYQRENDKTDELNQAKLAHKAGDPTPLKDITVPVVMPQVETAVVYQASVYLTGYPLFAVVADAEDMDAAKQMETVIADNAKRGGWTKELLMFFRDGQKYNFAPIELSWDSETTQEITTDIDFSLAQGKPVTTIWSGNKLRRWDPYNTFVDPRVPASEVYRKGEYAGHTEYMSRIQLKQFISDMSDTIVQNVAAAFESPTPGNPGYAGSQDTSERYFVPHINPDVTVSDNYTGDMNWLSWAGLEDSGTKGLNIKYKNAYELTTLYCKVLPSEFALSVPAPNTPQIWKLYIVNHQVIIHAERQTNAHGWIPVFIGMPKEDGLGYQTKSLATDAQPFQETASALMASVMASRRRAISDRVLYDPSRISSAVINSANPSAKMPVKPSAYGKKLSDSVYQFPYREDQGSFSIAQIRELMQMSDQLAGQNKAQQGQFVKGNKTLEEFQSTLGNASGRDQMSALLLEDQVFSKIKHVLKINILQFQGGTTLYNEDKKANVEIDPVRLRKAVLEFKVSDGLIPSSKLISADTLKVALQVIGSSPALGQSYEIGKLFSYLMKTQGADIEDFEKSKEQVAYEQALNMWQQLMSMAIEKDMDPSKLPPQPKPADFNYDPSGNQEEAGAADNSLVSGDDGS